MPLQIFEQALFKEIMHINGLIGKRLIGEISIEDKARNELLELRITLQKQMKKSKRYSENMRSEGDFTREEMVKILKIMREIICTIEISSIKQIIEGTTRYTDYSKASGKTMKHLKRNKVWIPYTED